MLNLLLSYKTSFDDHMRPSDARTGAIHHDFVRERHSCPEGWSGRPESRAGRGV
jgi:hypothetical protein